MKKQTVCGFFTLFSGLLAIANAIKLDAVVGLWPHGAPMGAALGLLSAIFATQWAEYRGRTPVAPTQPGTPGWLRRLLVGSVLLLTVLSTNAQTTWTRREQTLGGIVYDVAYGAGTYVAVGNGGIMQTSTDGIVWTTQVAYSNVAGDLRCVTYANGQFVVVGTSGRITTSPDGLTWSSRVSGTTEHLVGLAYGGGRFIAVGSNGIAITAMDGIAWTTLTTGTSVDLNDITYGSGTFTIVGDGGLIRTTPNGIIWTAKVSGTAVDLRGVTAGSNGQVVAVGSNNTVVSSPNGITWTAQVVAGTPLLLQAVTYDPVQGVYVAVAETTDHQLLRSPDGITWSSWSSGTQLSLFGVRYVNSRFIATGQLGIILSSLNGINWHPRTIGVDIQLNAAAYGNGHYVAVGKYPISLQPAIGSVAMTSTDGITYALGTTEHFAGAGEGFHDVVWGNGQFVAVGGEAIIQTSVDGKAWKLRHSGFGASVNGVAYGNGQYVAVGAGFGAGINLLRSSDGIIWTKSANGLPAFYAGITHANGQFVAVGFNGAIATSPEGIDWTAHSSGTSNLLRSVAYGNGSYVAVGASGTILRSADGAAWTSVVPFTAQTFNHITFGNGQFVVVGEDSNIFTSATGTVWDDRVSHSGGSTLNGITYGNGLFVAVGSKTMVTTSPDDGGVPPVNPGSFAITGVSLVSCQAISATQRQLVFSPQYSGLSGQPISFQVVNELVPTTVAGPYSLNMYIDNPTITLKATQSGTAGEASFGYNWLAACTGNGARLGVGEWAERTLAVRVLGNPVETGVLSIEVRGAVGQPLQMSLSDVRGQVVGAHRVSQAESVQEHTFEIGRQPAGLYLLRVSTSTRMQTVKVLKR